MLKVFISDCCTSLRGGLKTSKGKASRSSDRGKQVSLKEKIVVYFNTRAYSKLCYQSTNQLLTVLF